MTVMSLTKKVCSNKNFRSIPLSYASFGIFSVNRVIGAIEAYLKLEIGGAEDEAERSKKRASVVEIKDKKLMLTKGGDYIMVDGKFPRLKGRRNKQRLRAAVDMLRTLIQG